GLSHCRLRLLQPVRHPHLAVHRRRGGEMLLRLLAVARAPVELTETEVAVGDEGMRAKLNGQIERLTIETLCLAEVRMCPVGGDVGENLQDPCLPATSADTTAGVQRVLRGHGG